MLEQQELSSNSSFKDYGRLIRLVTGQSVKAFAEELEVTPSMIAVFEAGRGRSKRLIDAYNELIDLLNIDPLYDAIIERRQLLDEN